MPVTRRLAIQTLASAGATVLLPKGVRAREPKAPGRDAVSVLYDSARCIGCERCAVGCAEARGCDEALATAEDARLTPQTLTVVRSYETPSGRKAFRKIQCMHCVDPACVSACMLGAMRKNEDGSVTWNGDLCVGCRYCQIACPFNIPRFEWDTPAPELTKCDLCEDRRAAGLEPACVERCRMGALVYGTRKEMLSEASRRIAEHPERYNPEIYGDWEGGGTSMLYLARAGVEFSDMGLPALGNESVPSLPETIQHTLYKGFIAPLALFGLFGALVRRNTRLPEGNSEAEAPDHAASEPVGGRLWTWPFGVLMALFVIGLGAVVWRFVAGLGPVTNLNDGYAMGLWIAFDVVTGTALACGGYAMAILVYLANRGKYHPLVRAAIVTSALGYTLGGLSVLIDIGRAWNFYKIPLYFWEWNVNSILLEVALCIMFYTMVLWIEVSPAFLEKWRTSDAGRLRDLAVRATPALNRAMPYIIALGLVLPTMHQSSLGSLMLLAGSKLHPLWHTPLLPLLFLVSVVGMGYAAVTLESSISARVFRRPQETPMLRALARPIAYVLFTYTALRVVDVIASGKWELVMAMDGYSFLFLVELTLLTAPAFGLLLHRAEAGIRFFSAMAVAVILGGALYRFSTYLIAFNPGSEWSYFPSILEFAVTIGLVSAEVMGYLILVKRFPILRGAPRTTTGDLSPDAGKPDASGGQPRIATAGVVGAGLLLVALAATAVPVASQGLERPDQERQCLTDQAVLCLPEPVSPHEPHDAICATCHDFDAQGTPAEAALSCASGGCHERPETLTPFHRRLEATALTDCVRCHDPHDARIPAGAGCRLCHDAGVRFEQPREHQGPLPDSRDLELSFRHQTHDALECQTCHASSVAHAEFRITTVNDCRSCHHNQTLASNCMACHDLQEMDRGAAAVIRSLDISIGSLDRPVRTLPFDHTPHQGFACQSCHNEGLALSAGEASCGACHAMHHEPTAECRSCHVTPVEGAHDRDAHLGCGGAGCHDAATARIQAAPRSRELCLVCHQDRADHRVGRECASCHAMPAPRPADAPATSAIGLVFGLLFSLLTAERVAARLRVA